MTFCQGEVVELVLLLSFELPVFLVPDEDRCLRLEEFSFRLVLPRLIGKQRGE